MFLLISEQEPPVFSFSTGAYNLCHWSSTKLLKQKQDDANRKWDTEIQSGPFAFIWITMSHCFKILNKPSLSYKIFSLLFSFQFNFILYFSITIYPIYILFHFDSLLCPYNHHIIF